MSTTVIVPTTPLAPYDTVGYVLNLARVYLNDATNGISGDLLASDQPYAAVLLNSAFRKLQDRLMNAGVEVLVRDAIIPSVPVAATDDPSVETFLNWNGYWDGAALIDHPTLPFDMVIPLKVWERHAGTAEFFIPVDPREGVPETQQVDRFRFYEWKGDRICFRGATQVNDLKIRYLAYFAELDIADATPIPILRSARAIAYLMSSEFTRARGGSTADNFHALAEEEINTMTLRTTRRKQELSYRRRRY